MRHAKNTKKLNRTAAHRRALASNMARSLIENERITTTLAKARYLRPYIEKIITRAGEDTVHNRREVKKKLKAKGIVNKLFEDIGPRFSDRPGGYTRIIKLDRRLGDNAEKAIIEFVE